jgi:hypothetical protein
MQDKEFEDMILHTNKKQEFQMLLLQEPKFLDWHNFYFLKDLLLKSHKFKQDQDLPQTTEEVDLTFLKPNRSNQEAAIRDQGLEPTKPQILGLPDQELNRAEDQLLDILIEEIE